MKQKFLETESFSFSVGSYCKDKVKHYLVASIILVEVHRFIFEAHRLLFQCKVVIAFNSCAILSGFLPRLSQIKIRSVHCKLYLKLNTKFGR